MSISLGFSSRCYPSSVFHWIKSTTPPEGYIVVSVVPDTHPSTLMRVRTHATTRDNNNISHISVLVQVNSRPQVVCKHLSYNHFSAASDNSRKACLNDCPRKAKSNRSVVVDLASKSLTHLHCSCVLANLVALLLRPALDTWASSFQMLSQLHLQRESLTR